jgi:hypothetical protein
MMIRESTTNTSYSKTAKKRQGTVEFKTVEILFNRRKNIVGTRNKRFIRTVTKKRFQV